MFWWFSPFLSVSWVLEESIPTHFLTLFYISPQCSAVSPQEQVAWIIDASTNGAGPHMARTYKSYILQDPPAEKTHHYFRFDSIDCKDFVAV